MRCKRCNSEMKKVMHFEKGKSYQYNFCEKCLFPTRNKSIDFKQFETKEHRNEQNRNRKIRKS